LYFLARSGAMVAWTVAKQPESEWIAKAYGIGCFKG
jgi:hypothetical protein